MKVDFHSKIVVVKMMVDIKNSLYRNNSPDVEALAGAAVPRLKPRHPGAYHLPDLYSFIQKFEELPLLDTRGFCPCR